MKRAFLLLSLSFILRSACASPSLDGWVGQPFSRVVATVGYPQQTGRAPSGNLLYTYVDSFQASGPDFKYETHSRNLGYTIKGAVVTYWCNVFFEVNDQGIIVATSYAGNACGN